jgi:carotenoid cleavage dioxygenase-like enzyme
MVNKEQFVFAFNDNQPLRFGVLSRYAKDESQIRWFESSTTGFIFHVANAWEEGDEVLLIACRSPGLDLEDMSVYEKDKCDKVTTNLWEHRFNLKTGEIRERKLGELHTEFPTINDDYVGRKNRYVFTSIYEDASHVIGIAKYDLTLEPKQGKSNSEGGNLVCVFWLGNLRYGSEAIYVPKNPGKTVDEDDGYLLCFVQDENTGKSEVIVVDAKTMSSDPVAVIKLPRRVPYGFHSLFMTEEQLRSQKS